MSDNELFLYGAAYALWAVFTYWLIFRYDLGGRLGRWTIRKIEGRK